MATIVPALLNAAGAARDHGTPVNGSMGGGLWGIPSEHVLGLLAPLALPVAIWLVLAWMRGRTEGGSNVARRFMRRYDASSTAEKLAACLLLVAGAVHLGLAPGHWSADHTLAELFLVNAVCFFIVGAGVFIESWWRPAAIVLVVLTLLAYVSQIAAMKEGVDQVGVLTLLVEVAALGLAAMPERGGARREPGRLRLALAGGATVAALLIGGVILWGGELHAETQGQGGPSSMTMDVSMDRPMQGMVMQAVPNAPPTPEQQAAAAKLAAETKAEIARFADVNVALAAGYRPIGIGNAKTVHYGNRAYAKDGKILDPTRPEDLVYANTPHGPVLLGAMFLMPRPGGSGPDIGGPITRWHQHDNLCFGPGPGAIAGFLSPFDTCAAGTFNGRTPAMIHLWVVDTLAGPWGDVSPDWVASLVMACAPDGCR